MTFTREQLFDKYASGIKVGQHGFVRLVDFMGRDEAIVQAARTSYGKGTKAVSEDRGLIRYLMRHSHTTPFEMCEIKLHLKMPIHVARQFIRHRTASVNEYSTRYSEVPDQLEVLRVFRSQSTNNKQGSAGLVEVPEEVQTYFNNLAKGIDSEEPQWLTTLSNAFGDWTETPGMEDFCGGDDISVQELLGGITDKSLELAYSTYTGLLAAGVAREQARNVLPLATYTEMYWKIDLHNLLHFLKLRLDSHAQQEIRELAEAIAQIVKDWVPVAWEAFEDYKLYGISLSAKEVNIITDVMGQAFDDTEALIRHLGGFGLGKRELQELLVKLALE
jgi:thymidylate synthase (FAD)